MENNEGNINKKAQDDINKIMNRTYADDLKNNSRNIITGSFLGAGIGIMYALVTHKKVWNLGLIGFITGGIIKAILISIKK